jgi:hypothetical protein
MLISRLPPPAARVDRDQPWFIPEMHPEGIRVNPDPARAPPGLFAGLVMIARLTCAGRATASGRGLVACQPAQDGPEPQTWQ